MKTDFTTYEYIIPTSRRTRPKEVQVIPWSIKDSNYSVKTFQKLDPLKTIFVGALHGMMNAEGLFRVMNDLFGGVLYTGKCSRIYISSARFFSITLQFFYFHLQVLIRLRTSILIIVLYLSYECI